MGLIRSLSPTTGAAPLLPGAGNLTTKARRHGAAEDQAESWWLAQLCAATFSSRERPRHAAGV